MKPGERAGAVMSIMGDTKTIRLAGYGIYKGDEIPPKEIIFMGQSLHELKHTNPRIDLDNGHTIWGCQCWWGSEKAIKDKVKLYEENGYTVTVIDPSEYSNDD